MISKFYQSIPGPVETESAKKTNDYYWRKAITSSRWTGCIVRCRSDSRWYKVAVNYGPLSRPIMFGELIDTPADQRNRSERLRNFSGLSTEKKSEIV